MFGFEKKHYVTCHVFGLKKVLEDDLQNGVCCDIWFIYQGKKHQFGVYGDDGNSFKNCVYYLDQQEFQAKEELYEKGRIDGRLLAEMENEIIIVTECDGCWPDNEFPFE